MTKLIEQTNKHPPAISAQPSGLPPASPEKPQAPAVSVQGSGSWQGMFTWRGFDSETHARKDLQTQVIMASPKGDVMCVPFLPSSPHAFNLRSGCVQARRAVATRAGASTIAAPRRRSAHTLPMAATPAVSGYAHPAPSAGPSRSKSERGTLPAAQPPPYREEYSTYPSPRLCAHLETSLMPGLWRSMPSPRGRPPNPRTDCSSSPTAALPPPTSSVLEACLSFPRSRKARLSCPARVPCRPPPSSPLRTRTRARIRTRMGMSVPQCSCSSSGRCSSSSSRGCRPSSRRRSASCPRTSRACL